MTFIAADEGDSGIVQIFGAPYDGTASFRPGTRFGPTAIREASYGLETFSFFQGKDLEDVSFSDLGDLAEKFGAPEPMLAQVQETAELIIKGGGVPLMLGGEHSLTPPAVRAVFDRHPDVLVVQLDAHADLREEYLGLENSHACAMRRILDFLDRDSLIQFGIRSGTAEEYSELTSCGQYARTVDELRALLKDRPIYLTLDLDVFDPAFMPGTGTPEPGGIDWSTFEAILKALKDSTIVGIDVMELSPGLDPTGCSSVLAAKCVRELVLLAA